MSWNQLTRNGKVLAVLVGLLIAGIPALIIGLAAGIWLGMWYGLVIGGGAFLASCDIVFNGSDS